MSDKHCMENEMRNLTTEQYGQVMKTGDSISKLISQVPTNFFIAGGTVINFLRDRSYSINDRDMFFLSKKDRDDTFKWLIKNGWKRQGGNKVRSYWVHDDINKISFFKTHQMSDYKLNIIHNIFKTIPECIDAFDINICSIACTKTGVTYAKNLCTKLEMIKDFTFCFNRSINASNIDAAIKRVYKYCRKDFKPMPSVVRQIIEVLYKDKDYKSDVYEGIGMPTQQETQPIRVRDGVFATALRQATFAPPRPTPVEIPEPRPVVRRPVWYNLAQSYNEPQTVVTPF